MCLRACVCVRVCKSVRLPAHHTHRARLDRHTALAPIHLRPEGNARAWVCACEVQAHHHEGGKGRVCVRATANRKRQRSCVGRATAEIKSDRCFLHLAPNSAHGVLRGARAVHRHQVTPRESRNSRRNWERAVAGHTDGHTETQTDTQTDTQTQELATIVYDRMQPPLDCLQAFSRKREGVA